MHWLGAAAAWWAIVVVVVAVVVVPGSTLGFVVVTPLCRAKSVQYGRKGPTTSVVGVVLSAGSTNNDLTTSRTKSPLDSALTWLISDTGSVILGSVGLVVLLLGRLFWSDDETDDYDDGVANADALTTLTRQTLLAVVAIGAVLLNGLSQLDVPTALAEMVNLEGILVPESQIVNHQTNTMDNSSSRVSWVLDSLVQATPAVSAVFLQRNEYDGTTTALSGWKIVGYVGILPEHLLRSPASFQLPMTTPILDRFGRPVVVLGESYLPTLPALPGKVEFTYLPSNTQAVLILPSGPNGVIVLGSNQSRCFTPRDIAWCQAAVSQLK